jgi:hypothetical protein
VRFRHHNWLHYGTPTTTNAQLIRMRSDNPAWSEAIFARSFMISDHKAFG